VSISSLTVPPDSALQCALDCASEARAADLAGAAASALQWYDRAIGAFGVGEGASLLADVLRWKGTVLRERGDTAEARALYERSLAVADAMEYREGHAHALNCLGIVDQRRGKLDDAERRYNEAALLAAGTGDRRLAAMVQQNLGVIANIRGDIDVALVRYRMALRIFDEIGDDEARSWVLNNIGMLCTDRRDFTPAADAFDRGLALARARGDVRVEQALELNRVEMLVVAQRWAAAEAGSVLALHAADARDDRLQRGEALKLLGVCERQRAEYQRALETLERARACAAEAEDTLLLAEVLREMGETMRAQDRVADARTAWERSAALFAQIGAARDADAVVDNLHRLSA